MGNPAIEHKGLCVINHLVKCAKFRLRREGPNICCDGPVFEMKMIVSGFCFGDGCPELEAFREKKLRMPFLDRPASDVSH